jgi:hypothetical protein
MDTVVFDFMYNDQKIFTKDYFEKRRIVETENNSNKENVELMLDFMDKKYGGLITPTTLKHFFEKCMDLSYFSFIIQAFI